MKKIERLPPPDCLDNKIEKFKRQQLRFYINLRDKNGNIQPRWNTTCKEGGEVSKIRLKLLEMSSHTCVYCGVKIDNADMEVDHYLPSSKFPYLAYCWENFLPACGKCNLNKLDFVPKSLTNKKIVEDILFDKFEYDLIYGRNYILNQITKNDRLIEPSFDIPEEHLEFIPELYSYEAKTKIGEITIRSFFNHIVISEKFEELSDIAKDLVLKMSNSREILNSLKKIIKSFGYEYVFLKYYEYWLQEKEEERIYRI